MVLSGVLVLTAASADALDVSVGETRIIMRGANYPVSLKLADGMVCQCPRLLSH